MALPRQQPAGHPQGCRPPRHQTVPERPEAASAAWKPSPSHWTHSLSLQRPPAERKRQRPVRPAPTPSSPPRQPPPALQSAPSFFPRQGTSAEHRWKTHRFAASRRPSVVVHRSEQLEREQSGKGGVGVEKQSRVWPARSRGRWRVVSDPRRGREVVVIVRLCHSLPSLSLALS